MLWNLREAKNKLSQVIHYAQTTGPQTIAIQGKATAVVLSNKDYQKRLIARFLSEIALGRGRT